MLGSVFQHIVLIMTFRHNGFGLPVSGPVPYILLAVSSTTDFARSYLDTEFLLAVILAVLGFGFVLLVTIRSKWLMAPIALTTIGGNAVYILLWIVGLKEWTMIAMAWMLIALITFSTKRSRENSLDK